MNQAEIDMQSADFRAVSASIEGTTPEDVERNKDDIISSFQQPVVKRGVKAKGKIWVRGFDSCGRIQSGSTKSSMSTQSRL
jgi:hypothetical protein